jgi:hypothetical protein
MGEPERYPHLPEDPGIDGDEWPPPEEDTEPLPPAEAWPEPGDDADVSLEELATQAIRRTS